MSPDIAERLPAILAAHMRWRRGEEGGERANLAGADLARADLAGACLARADLAGACLAGANLAGAYLTDAYLADANLAGAYLADANLAGAYLTGACLAGAYLTGACLAGANLAGANLTGANLAGTNLAGTNLVDGGQRSDGHRFVGWSKDGVLLLRAGCRSMTLTEYRAHNTKHGSAALRDETTAILDHIQRVAAIREMLK